MKKNIVVVVSAMNMGGAQRVVSILCDHWSQNGYVVTLITTFTEEKVNHYQVNNDVALKYLSMPERILRIADKFLITSATPITESVTKGKSVLQPASCIFSPAMPSMIASG